MRLDPYVTPNIGNNSKCIKDIKVKAETLKLLEVLNLCNLRFSNGFLDIIPKSMSNKIKN